MANPNGNGKLKLDIAVIGLVLMLAANVAAFAYSYGTFSARLTAVEDRIERSTQLLERYIFPQYIEPRQ